MQTTLRMEAEDLSRLSLLLTDILGDLNIQDRNKKAWKSMSVIRQVKDPKAGGLLWLASQLLTGLIRLEANQDKTTSANLKSWDDLADHARFCPPWISIQDLASAGSRLELLLFLASSLQNQMVGRRRKTNDNTSQTAKASATPASNSNDAPALILPDHLTPQQRDVILMCYQGMQADYDKRRTGMQQRLDILVADFETDGNNNNNNSLANLFPTNHANGVHDLSEEELVQHFTAPHSSQQQQQTAFKKSFNNNDNDDLVVFDRGGRTDDVESRKVATATYVPTPGMTPGPTPGPTPGYIPGTTPSPGATSSPGPEWDILLSMAMKNNAPEIHRLITEQGVSPSHANAVAQSALHIAALWGNVEAVEALLQHKAAVNAQNSMTGATPLHCTAQSAKGTVLRRMECIDLLIANGADVSKPDFFGKTAADYCDIKEDGPSMAKKLQPQRPELFQAIDDGNLEQVQALVVANDVKQMSFMGQTPFLYTLGLLLTETTDDNDSNVKPEDKSQWVEILKILLDAGADVNEVPGADSSNPMAALEGNASTPLHQICDKLQVSCKENDSASINLWQQTCDIFLKHKATVSPELEQMLHTACRKGELKFVQLLITVIGVDPNVKGRQGMTPLQFAARSGKVDIVQYLLSDHHTKDIIDISIQDDRGKTALDAARANDKQEIVALLEAFTTGAV